MYSNENFPLPVVAALRGLGHDVLTSYESGRANHAIPDGAVLAFAVNQNRIVLTLNRKHFTGLHNKDNNHAGIIVCTFDPDATAMAVRIDTALKAEPEMKSHLIRINRPQIQP